MPLKLAIVGRPNVGKSTLFNRLAGKKLALVDDRPGVTRDRRYATGRLGDLDLNLIDTAGFEDATDESLEARMRAQTEAALIEAQVAIFVIDALEGVVPLDEVFAEVLRKYDKPVVMVANKAEGKAGEAGTMEAYRLGFGEPVPLSATHGEGMSDLYDALAALEGLDEGEDEDQDKPVRLAIVGRPNAGKSTLVNRLLGEERMLTGPEAGITRDSIPVDWTWDDRRIRLVDTAGLRRKAKVQEKLERLSTQDTIRSITFAEIVLLIMDATHPFETQDLQIADLVEREGRGLVFVLAKWDLVEDPQATLKAFIEHAERMLPQVKGAPVVALSAETGWGVDRLMPAVFKVYDNWSTKVKTRDLNDWLGMAVQRHPPPAVEGRRVKPKYMAQIKARPPTFVLIASRASQLPDSYKRYLVNSLRQSFDLPGVPIRLTIKAGKNPYAEGEGATAGPRLAKPSKFGKPERKRPAPAPEGAVVSGLPGKAPAVKRSPAAKAAAAKFGPSASKSPRASKGPFKGPPKQTGGKATARRTPSPTRRSGPKR